MHQKVLEDLFLIGLILFVIILVVPPLITKFNPPYWLKAGIVIVGIFGGLVALITGIAIGILR